MLFQGDQSKQSKKNHLLSLFIQLFYHYILPVIHIKVKLKYNFDSVIVIFMFINQLQVDNIFFMINFAVISITIFIGIGFAFYQLYSYLDQLPYQAFDSYHRQSFTKFIKDIDHSHLRNVNQILNLIYHELEQNQTLTYIETNEQELPRYLTEFIDTKLTMYTVFHYNTSRIIEYQNQKKNQSSIKNFVLESIQSIGLKQLLRPILPTYHDTILQYTVSKSGKDNWIHNWIFNGILYRQYFIKFLKKKAEMKKVVIMFDDISKISTSQLAEILEVYIKDLKINKIHVILFSYDKSTKKQLFQHFKESSQLSLQENLKTFEFLPDLYKKKRQRLQQMAQFAKGKRPKQTQIKGRAQRLKQMQQMKQKQRQKLQDDEL